MRRGYLKYVPSALFFLNALPVLMLATGFFWCSSLGVFHYSGAAKASQDAPQDGAKLDLVLGSILGRFFIDFGMLLGGQNAPKTVPDAPWTVQDGPEDGPKLDIEWESIFTSVFGCFWEAKTLPRRPQMAP